jgi:hypothetical protein
MLASSIDTVFPPKDAKVYWEYSTLITTLQGSNLRRVTLPSEMAGAYAAIFTVYATNMAQLPSYQGWNGTMDEFKESYLDRVGPFITEQTAAFLKVEPKQVSVVMAQNRTVQPSGVCDGPDFLVISMAVAFTNTKWCARPAVDFIIETLRTRPGDLFPEMGSTSLDPRLVNSQVR